MLTAWFEVFPRSAATKRSATQLCSRFLKWYEEEFPPTFDQAAAAFGLSPYRLMRNLNEMLNATKWAWDEKVGGRIETSEPDWRARSTAHREIIKLVEKSEIWRRRFLDQDQDKPMQLNTPPEFKTFEEFEEWRKSHDLLGEIERKRKEATEARDRAAAAEGRMLPTRPFGNSGHQQ